jgi:hypothetical protein
MTIEGFIGIYQPLTGIYSELSYLCMTYLGGILGFVQYIYICPTTGDRGRKQSTPVSWGFICPLCLDYFGFPLYI